MKDDDWPSVHVESKSPSAFLAELLASGAVTEADLPSVRVHRYIGPSTELELYKGDPSGQV